MFQKDQNLKKALPFYLKTIYHDPMFLSAYYQIGSIYGQRGEHDQEFRYFKQMVDLRKKFHPDFLRFENGDVHYEFEEEYSLANYTMGMEFLKGGQTDQAYAYFQEAVKYNQGFGKAIYQMAVIDCQRKELTPCNEKTQRLYELRFNDEAQELHNFLHSTGFYDQDSHSSYH